MSEDGVLELLYAAFHIVLNFGKVLKNIIFQDLEQFCAFCILKNPEQFVML
jgi:hypothetical protein